jgi:peptide/nickel transport system substrate-binding protein
MNGKELLIKLTKYGLVLVIAASLLLSLSVIGCSQPASTPTPKPAPATTPAVTPTSQPQYGGILRIIDQAPSRGIGWPGAGSGPYDTKQQWPCLEALWSVDKNSDLKPLLASDWEIAPGWTSVTFHLRKGVKFHDGTDWNADAAKYVLDAVKADKLAGTEVWTLIDLIDPYTIKINISKFENTQKIVIGSIKFPSPTAVKTNGKDWAMWHPVGTGPFKFKSFEPNVSLEYEKFDGYWQKGLPYLDGIKFIYIADQLTKTNAMETGASDLLIIDASQQTKYLQDKGFIVEYLNQTGWSLAPDSANPNSPFADKRVREAVDYTINREELCTTTGFGQVKPLYQYASAYYYGHNPDIAGRKYDPAKAKQLLAEAGYASGFKTTLNVDTRIQQEYVVAWQGYLRAVGIDADVNTVTPGVATDSIQKNGWKGLIFSPIPILGGQVLNGLKSFDTRTPNLVSVKKPEGLQPVLESALAAEDMQSMDKLTKQVVKIIYDDVTIIPILVGGPTATYVKGLHDVRWQEPSVPFWWNPTSAWLGK